jgi:hypothetical protein
MITFDAADLELQLLDGDSIEWVRLFRHPGGEWDPPPPQYRTLRVDPPPGRENDYAVLYTADSIAAVAIECRILACDTRDRYTYDAARTEQCRVARYAMRKAAIFMPIDGENRRRLGLRGFGAGYLPFQTVAHEVFLRFGGVVHGLSWESFHRGQHGRVYALWHHHKSTVDLALTSTAPYVKLAADAQWQALLAARPDIDELGPLR